MGVPCQLCALVWPWLLGGPLIDMWGWAAPTAGDLPLLQVTFAMPPTVITPTSDGESQNGRVLKFEYGLKVHNIIIVV